MKNPISFLTFSMLFLMACSSEATHGQKSNTPVPQKAETITKPDSIWKKELSPMAYHVLREKGTERAFSSELYNIHSPGVYVCAACKFPLFDAETKFDSGTGWPSFYAPISEENIRQKDDKSLGMHRNEVLCPQCGGHLGHVFNDGPKPTGMRYCMNGAALHFEKK